MAEKGKFVHVFGAPFTGKTYLIAKLYHEIDNVSVVNYELFLKEGGYDKFYESIEEKLSAGKNVIAESVNNQWGRRRMICEESCSLHVFAYPSNDIHKRNFENFKRLAGQKYADTRTGSFGIDKLRDSVKLPWLKQKDRLIRFTGNNYSEIKEAISCHFK